MNLSMPCQGGTYSDEPSVSRLLSRLFMVLSGGETNIAFGSKTRGDDKILRLRSAAVRGLDGPAAFVGIELSIDHHAFKRSLALDIEDLVAVIEVVPQLFVGRIVGRPVVSVQVSQLCKITLLGLANYVFHVSGIES